MKRMLDCQSFGNIKPIQIHEFMLRREICKIAKDFKTNPDSQVDLDFIHLKLCSTGSTN